MDIAGYVVCLSLCLGGGVYALGLLLGCYRQMRPAAARDEPATHTRRPHLAAQINWVCQLILAGAFLLSAGAVLVTIVQECMPALASLRAGDSKSIGTVQVGGMGAFFRGRTEIDCDHPDRPIVGVDLAGLPVTDADIRMLARHAPQAKWLNLAETDITDDSLSIIGQMPRLTKLNLSRTRITDSGLRHLRQNSLETLWLVETPITDDGVEYLGRLTNLKELQMRNTRVTDAVLPSLRPLHQLERLGVHETKVTPRGARQLMEQMPRRVLLE